MDQILLGFSEAMLIVVGLGIFIFEAFDIFQIVRDRYSENKKTKKSYIESNKEIKERILKLTDGKDYGIFPPPTDAQVALDELCRFLLGDSFYTFSSNNKQGNTEILYEIEKRYKKSHIRKRLNKK